MGCYEDRRRTKKNNVTPSIVHSFPFVEFFFCCCRRLFLRSFLAIFDKWKDLRLITTRVLTPYLVRNSESMCDKAVDKTQVSQMTNEQRRAIYYMV